MLKISHKCGYTRTMQFTCPQCKEPFCEEDTEQVNGGALLGHVKNYDLIAKVIEDLDKLEKKFKALKERVDNCSKCPK